MAKFIQQEEPASKPAKTVTSGENEAFEMALAYARATSPSQRANAQRYFSEAGNKQHAHFLTAAQRLPSVSPNERANLLKERFGRR